MNVEKEQTQQASSSQTRDILLDAAIAEFGQNGYFDTSVDTITGRAGVSHGTFYLYFKNKQNVLSVLIGQIDEQLSAVIKEKNNDEQFLSSGDYASFEGDIRLIASVIFGASGLFRAFLQAMVHNKEIFDLFARISRTVGDVLDKRLRQKQAEGASDRVDPLVLSQIMAIMFYQSLFIHSLGIIQCDPDVLTRHIATILFSIMGFDDKLMKTRKKKSEARKAALIKTRKELINMAREEFSRYGYFDTRIADIAQKAGYSRGTFYQYFTDKDDVIQAIMNEMFYQNRNQTSIVDFIVMNLDATVLEELMRISTIVLDLFDKYSSFSWTLLQGAFYSEKLGRFYGEMFVQFSKPIQEKIVEQQQEGTCQGLDPLVTAEIILTTVSYSIFMFFGGLIRCSKELFSANMGIFLFSMLNYVNPQDK